MAKAGASAACHLVSVVVRNGAGTYNFQVKRCQSAGSAFFRIGPSGSVSGTTSGYTIACEALPGTITGRYADGRVTFSGDGNNRASLMRKWGRRRLRVQRSRAVFTVP